MNRPFYPIHVDVVMSRIVPHLNVQDIGRLMCCSKNFYEFFVRDEWWSHIRDRCIAAVPIWKPMIFDAFPWNTIDNHETDPRKARMRESSKQAFKIPVGGIWKNLKTYVGKAKSAKTIKLLLNSKSKRFDSAIPEKPLRHRMFVVHDGGTWMKLKGQYPQDHAKCAVLAGVGCLFFPNSPSITLSSEWLTSPMIIQSRNAGTMTVARISPSNPWFITGTRKIRKPPGFKQLFWF